MSSWVPVFLTARWGACCSRRSRNRYRFQRESPGYRLAAFATLAKAALGENNLAVIIDQKHGRRSRAVGRRNYKSGRQDALARQSYAGFGKQIVGHCLEVGQQLEQY